MLYNSSILSLQNWRKSTLTCKNAKICDRCATWKCWMNSVKFCTGIYSYMCNKIRGYHLKTATLKITVIIQQTLYWIATQFRYSNWNDISHKISHSVATAFQLIFAIICDTGVTQDHQQCKHLTDHMSFYYWYIPDGAKKRPEHSQVLCSSVTDRFLPARRYASAGLCDSDVSVRPSVCHTPVLCLAERKQDREMYTIW